MAQSITDVAAFILTRTGTIATMQLHKLAFYAQAEHLVKHQGAPLFPEDFYAWRSGPVCPLLFILHRNKFIIRPGELPQGDPDRLSDEEKNLIIRICTALGETTGIGTELSERVLSEDPWLDARGNKKAHDPGDTLIPKIAMGVYYFEHRILR
jgi:uncharacterized phage-associated protein